VAELIYLVGMKHSGKTHHGASVAATLGYGFLDIDSLIQELDATEGGTSRSVRRIYAEDGPARFRQLEAAACRLAAERDAPTVIATGGGICDNDEAKKLLQEAITVYVHDSLERLTARVFRSGIPAFLGTDDPSVARSRFSELYERRTACYRRFATVTIDVTGMGLEEAGRAVVSGVREYLDGR
jgi:shikimate kinase